MKKEIKTLGINIVIQKKEQSRLFDLNRYFKV